MGRNGAMITKACEHVMSFMVISAVEENKAGEDGIGLCGDGDIGRLFSMEHSGKTS